MQNLGMTILLSHIETYLSWKVISATRLMTLTVTSIGMETFTLIMLFQMQMTDFQDGIPISEYEDLSYQWHMPDDFQDGIPISTSGFRTSETGGAKFWPKFLNEVFLGVSRKNFHISPKKFHLSPKISDDFFFSHRPFSWFHHGLFCRGENPLPKSDRGAKILTFRQIHSAIITLSALKGGQTPLPTSMGGAMAGFGPHWIRRCPFQNIKK